MRSLVVSVVAVAACGPGLSEKRPTVEEYEAPPPVRQGVPPPTAEAEVRSALASEVTNGGLFFADVACEQQFGQAGPVPVASFDAFAHCIATLELTPTDRRESIDDVSLLTDKLGFEIEAHVVAGKLDFIGFSGRAPGVPDLPSITPETLETLRIAGDPNVTITDEQAKELISPNAPRPAHEQLRICLADDGRVASILPATTTSATSYGAASALVRNWRFRSFAPTGTPLPVCVVVDFQYPALPREPGTFPRPPDVSKSGHIVFRVSPKRLESLRLTGKKLVAPDDDDKSRIQRSGIVKRIGKFSVCFDETGHYESGVLVQSTGIPGYDAKIARELMSWSFQPYLFDLEPIPICARYTFIYLQR